MKLFLIRHGESEANLNKVYAGQSDVALTELGRQQAQQIRPILAPIHFDKVYSSDLCRAIDTQTLVVPGVEGERTPLLREYDVGTLAGQRLGQAKIAGVPGRTWDYTSYGGENTEMACKRMRKFLAALEAQPFETVAAFAHNGMIMSMLQIVLDTYFDAPAVRSGNCAIHVFEFDGTKWRLLAWNYMGPI